jgi:hypothetical protein
MAFPRIDKIDPLLHRFNSGERPSYRDFTDLAMTIGMTF